MAGAGTGEGLGPAVGKLESNIYCIKYTLFCFNVVLWTSDLTSKPGGSDSTGQSKFSGKRPETLDLEMTRKHDIEIPQTPRRKKLDEKRRKKLRALFGVSIFALCLWICVEPGFNEWMRILELQKYFIGIYIILIASLGIMVVAFLGCGSALMENVLLLYAYIASQIAIFVFGLVGACVVLDFSTYDSNIQPLIRDVIVRLMNNPQHEGSREILRMVQEGIGCCGADGPMDFINMNKPLPAECRDSVTGNAYFHGCVDELTWYLEGKTGWLAGIVLASCMISVVNAVMSLILIHAVKKEEEEATIYKN